MRRDGVRTGYDIPHTRGVTEAASVPLIASGGAGAPEHFRDAFLEAGASGALAATVFHDRILSIPDLKEYLTQCGIEMRR
jgi:cyclase